MHKLITLFILFSLSLLGCKETEMNLSTLAGQKFTLIAINGETYSGPNAPVIEFGENSMLFGKICNSFRGPAELSNGTLTMKNAAVTKMMCIDGELNKLETMMLKMLASGAEISVGESGLALKMGSEGLLFTAAPAAQD